MPGEDFFTVARRLGRDMAMGQKPVSPREHPWSTYPKMVPLVLTHSHIKNSSRGVKCSDELVAAAFNLYTPALWCVILRGTNKEPTVKEGCKKSLPTTTPRPFSSRKKAAVNKFKGARTRDKKENTAKRNSEEAVGAGDFRT